MTTRSEKWLQTYVFAEKYCGNPTCSRRDGKPVPYIPFENPKMASAVWMPSMAADMMPPA